MSVRSSFTKAVAAVRKHPFAAAGIGAGLLIGTLAVTLGGDGAGGGRLALPEPVDLHGSETVEGWLRKTADAANYDEDFVAFGMATAKRESGFHLTAKNDSAKEAEAACNLYHGSEDLYGSGRDAEFCWGSGSWFGGMPATYMKPSIFRHRDPRVVMFTAPGISTMFADFVSRIVKGYFPKLPPSARNWLSIRRAMASLGVMYDHEEKNKSGRAKAVRERLENDLIAVGADPDLMWRTPRVSDYPGAKTVYQALLGAA